MTEAKVQNKVDSVIASAGTGKTYRLVEAIANQVLAGTLPHRILATTFTKKAAAELAGRIRAKLIELGRPDLGAGMLSARIGTVNSVCGALINEFAFEMGRPPVSEVLAEDRQAAVFDRAVGAVIEQCGPAISEIAERFGIQARGYALPGRSVRGWQDEVRRAVDMARSNGIAPEKLAHCAARSAASLTGLLPVAGTGETAQSLNDALATALRGCIVQVNDNRDLLKVGTLKKDVPAVEKALRTLDAGERVAWPDWAKLAKLGATKADAALFTDVIAAAAAHPRHPGLRADIDVYTGLIFDCAMRCMTAYADYKKARGLLDFVDQEMLALEIIQSPDNAERLREIIGAVFVDEFQDSSPIQIAIFTALSQIAGGNLWVGDPKQSIYGFRDADPALTSTASAAITTATGGKTDYLRRSWRTRPQLADFVNAAITPNMLRAGMTIDEVAFDGCARPELEGMPAALSSWTITGKNKRERTAMLAGRVAGLLAEPDAWPVSKKDGSLRDARGGDIAILCRSNAQVTELAAAVASYGIRVAVERPGLLDQPESEFVLAALRWVADPSDTLALAELARLAGDDDNWLTAVFEADAETILRAGLPFAAALVAIRERAAQLTPAETFDAILHADTVLESITRWGDAAQRLQNLEALRDLISLYQDEQHAERQAATLAGASEWIAARKDARQPESRHPDAVNILTYHGAKGLEWPIVLLTELDAAAKGSPFGLSAENETPPAWNAPLGQRVLRFWPWPYGEQQKDVGLDLLAPASEQGIAALAEERLERSRLLYVGMTRARDHLGLATTGGALAWLDELVGDDGAPLIAMTGPEVQVGTASYPRRAEPEALALTDPGAASGQLYLRTPAASQTHPPLGVRPSDQHLAEGKITIAATHSLGARFALAGDPDLQRLGEAIHRFVAADDPARDIGARTALANAVLARWEVPQVRGVDLIEMADRLGAFLTKQFSGSPTHSEWPVHALRGLQIVSGRLDLLVDLGNGYAIIDHKSFPGSIEFDEDRLRAFAGQVALYAHALEQATGRTRFEYWIHQPIAAVITQIILPQ